MLNNPQNRVDCIFVFAPSGENINSRFFYHIGSSYIISLLRINGYIAEQFIFGKTINLKSCVKKILTRNPRVVGFTVYNSNFITSVLIAEEIKKVSPGTIITCGGPTSTNYSEFILEKYPFIDVCFRNESEETFLQFFTLLSGTGFDLGRVGLEQIKGISYRCENRICFNTDSNIFVNNSRITDYLDKYPSPYLNGVIPGADAYEVGLLTARGCNQNCVYCNCAVLSKRRFTTHSVDRVISELDYISGFNAGNQSLNFFDDAFSLIPQRAKSICKAIIENKIKIPLGCVTRCDTADEELLDLMNEAGFVSVGFSLESANPGTLRIIGKVYKPEDNPSDKLEKEIRFIERLELISSYAKKIGIKNVFASIMIGLPNETYRDAKRTIDTIDKNVNIDFYTHNLLHIFKGTPLYNNFQKYGYKIEFIDDNPIFSKTIYPDKVTQKVKPLTKSTLFLTKKENDKKTLRILSLLPDPDKTKGWFKNIILLSDKIEKDFVSWLRIILSLNGTIIQIYSDKDALVNHLIDNNDSYFKYFSPSLNIRNYYFKRKNKCLQLISSQSSFKNDDDNDDLKICDFNLFNSNLGNPDFDFLKVLCRESDSADANSAYNYFYNLKGKGDLFDYLINNKPLPSFINLCRWTKTFSNCKKKETLIINDKSELRFCWYGNIVGTVGQSYNELIHNYESSQKRILDKRKCNICDAKDYCNKCITPFPLTDEEYCTRQKLCDLGDLAEMIMSFDEIKQYV
jgi:radical SAM superfamily enzyme YgiQ (UPF0313 family)